MTKDFVCVGVSVKPRGLDGTLKLALSTDNFVARAIENRKETVFYDEGERQFTAQSFKVVSGAAFVKFLGISDVEAARALVGKNFYVKKSEIELPKDRHFICDLLGLAVFVGDKPLGELCDVLQYGAADVYVVKTDGGEVSFPALKNLIEKIDTAAKTIIINPAVFEEVAVFKDK